MIPRDLLIRIGLCCVLFVASTVNFSYETIECAHRDEGGRKCVDNVVAVIVRVSDGIWSCPIYKTNM